MTPIRVVLRQTTNQAELRAVIVRHNQHAAVQMANERDSVVLPIVTPTEQFIIFIVRLPEGIKMSGAQIMNPLPEPQAFKLFLTLAEMGGEHFGIPTEHVYQDDQANN